MRCSYIYSFPVPNKVATALTKLRPRLSVPSLLCWTLFALLFLYPLSVGPTYLLVSRGYLPARVGVIYAPLEQLASQSDSFDSLLEWYIERWLPAPSRLIN